MMFSLRKQLTAWLVIIAFTTPILALPSKAFAQPNSPVLRIAVSANFTETLKTLLPSFTQQTGIRTQIISGSTGNLFQQIIHGAPYDIFFSADTSRPEKLVALGKADAASRKTYAIGELAFWSANWTSTESLPTFANLLETLSVSEAKFAIANPTLAPYGKAAKQALTELALWPKLSHQLITGININQTFQQIRSQAVAIGIVAHSQLKQNNFHGIAIPPRFYQPIAQQLVIVSNSKQATNAKQLSAFMLSDAVQQILAQQGYQTATNLPAITTTETM